MDDHMDSRISSYNGQVVDSRKSSKWMTNGQKMDDSMDSRKSSANSSRKSDNDSNYYSKSSSYSSSYQKTSINGAYST